MSRERSLQRFGLHGTSAADRGDLLGDVDADRAPGDAAPAPDAARASELIVPGGELVSEPLPVAGTGARAHRSAVQVRKIEGEARIPAPPAFGSFSLEVAGVFDRGAETG